MGSDGDLRERKSRVVLGMFYGQEERFKPQSIRNHTAHLIQLQDLMVM